MTAKPKRCAKCSGVKLRSEFPTHASSSDGYASYCKACRNDMHTKRRSQNIRFRMKHHMATRMTKQLEKHGNVPKGLYSDMERYLGYKIVHLKRALAADVRAREGISFKVALDRGYHIDHIKPLSSFDVRSARDAAFRECWAIGNLRLIPAAENLAKGSKIQESLG